MDLTFAEFENTRSHWWWRPGWGPGVRYLTFHLTFEGAEDLHDAVRTLTTSLSELDAVDPVPEEWLHMTMTGLASPTTSTTPRGMRSRKRSSRPPGL